jgi:CRP-like cAMP-binding protein
MTDTSAFFAYPGSAEENGPPPGFLAHGTEDDWARLLDRCETRRFRPGELVLRRGASDRALYLLVDGWLKAPSGVVHPITTLGEAAFLDGRPRAVDVKAMTDGEVMRLGYDAFESLAADAPALGRRILVDVARLISARLKATGERTAGWTG